MHPAPEHTPKDFNELVFNSTDAILAVVDSSGIIAQVNRAWTQFGLANGAGDQTTWGEGACYFRNCPPSAGDTTGAVQAFAGIRAVQEGRLAVFELEYPCNSPDKQRWFQMRVLPLRGSTGTVLIAHTDITARKLAEAEKEHFQEQLYQAQKLESIGRLAGGVAHDFNNMLQAILGNLEIALDDLPADHPIRSLLEDAQGCAQHSASITRQLLAFARKQQVMPEELDLNGVVESAIRLLRPLLGENIELVWQPGEDPWLLMLDAGKIHQLLTNLCLNARDAISGTGRITVSSANVVVGNNAPAVTARCPPGEYVRLSVSDTGGGIPSEVRDHLFEPFFTTKPVGKGTGLGLATVYGIVCQHGGTITVQSETGQGTTFDVLLPRHHAETTKVAGVESGTSVMPGAGVILVVEDEPAIMRNTAMVLRRRGYTVLSACSAEEARQIANSTAQPIDLLLCDVVLPGCNGYDLAREMRAIHPDLEYIMISGYPAQEHDPSGAEASTVHFLAKPISPKELTARVQEVLVAKNQSRNRRGG
jgi:signal transduction histidine kinase/CheY-like chemotaxis protein